MAKIIQNSDGRLRKKENNFAQESEIVDFYEFNKDKETIQEKSGWLEFIKKHRFIFGFAALVALFSVFFGWRSAGQFSASLALNISRQGTQETLAEYKYDSYYALKATDEFGDTVAGWFKLPEITSAVLKAAGQETGGWSLGALSKRFQASKISPSLVEVRFSVGSQEEADRISGAIKQVIPAQAELLGSYSLQGIAFAVIGGEPILARNTFNLFLSVLGGFLVGLIFGFFIKVAKEYFFQ